jgi:hypothetical protein
VATMDECMRALKGILGDLAANPAAAGLDRSLSCRLTDLNQEVPKADIRLTMSSDDLVAMTDGRLHFGSAWATGRVKLEAGLRDLLRLRKIL